MSLLAPAEYVSRYCLLYCVILTDGAQVPLDPPSNADHPCAALAIAHIRVLVSQETFAAVIEEFKFVVGDGPSTASEFEVTWALNTLQGNSATRFILSTPRDSDEHGFLRESVSGIYEVAFWVEKGRDKGTVTTPYGRIVWLPKEV